MKFFLASLFLATSLMSSAQTFDPIKYVPSFDGYPIKQVRVTNKWPYFNQTPRYIGAVLGFEGFRSNFVEGGLAFNFVEFEDVPGGMIGGNLLYKRNVSERIQSYEAEVGFYTILCGGINFNWNQFDNSGLLGVKPFIGVSIFNIHVMYGYNIFQNSKNTNSQLWHNSFTIRYVMPIVTFGKVKSSMKQDYISYPRDNYYNYNRMDVTF